MVQTIFVEELSGNPVLGRWKISETATEYPGYLSYVDGELRLVLFLTIDGPHSFIYDDRAISPFAPPNQPTIHGDTRSAGKVTLIGCSILNHVGTRQFAPPLSTIELTLRPTQGWTGNTFLSPSATYRELKLHAPGLHSVLATSAVEHISLQGPPKDEKERAIKTATGAVEAYLVRQSESPKARITHKSKDYQVHFSSSYSVGHSNLDGPSLTTNDFIHIEATASTPAELQDVAYEVEQFLSILCLGPFRGTQLTISESPIHEVKLLWKLGTHRARGHLRSMPHQVLGSLGKDPPRAAKALEKWFGANDPTRLSRWLIFDALFEDVSSASKFLAVAQAWEIIGRQNGKVPPHNKAAFRAACRDVRQILERTLGPAASERLTNLLRSSNKQSLADLIAATLAHLPSPVAAAICGDQATFIKTVVAVRNVLTHMQGNRKLSINRASYLSMFLTFKLMVLFCIYTCVELDLPLDDLQVVLANNTLASYATRPLPLDTES